MHVDNGVRFAFGTIVGAMASMGLDMPSIRELLRDFVDDDDSWSAMAKSIAATQQVTASPSAVADSDGNNN